MSLAQIFAVVIFVSMFILIVTEIIEKQYTTLLCGLLTIVLVFGIGMQSFDAVRETVNVEKIFTLEFWYAPHEAEETSTEGTAEDKKDEASADETAVDAGNESAEAEGGENGISWATIIFLFGMMVMVEGMARVGFFRWLCMEIAKLVKYKVIPILLTFMVLSFILSMFIDSITVILFLASVTIELATLLKFNPVMMILAEVFCANLGGSATMCGDPPNIIVGTSLGYSFMDFVMNTGLVALISFVVIIIYFYFICRKALTPHGEVDTSSLPDPKSAITDKQGFIISCVIFGIAVILLVTHAQTGLSVATIGVFIAIITLIMAPKYIGEILKHVDYKTLLFFIGLFIVVGGLEQTGILVMIANFIGEISAGNFYVMIAIIIWVSAICSAFVDNIPFAATMIPIIQSLSQTQGIHLDTLSWTLAMGTDVGGSATPIGASANVVGVAKANQAGHPIRWGRYCLAMAPATIITVTISMLYIYIRYL